MATATPTDFAQNAQEQTLKSIRQSQQTVIEAVRTWATAVEKTVPELPALPAVPFANELPTPTEIVKTSFEFAEQLLKTQREFAENLVAATASVFESAPPAPKSTQKA
jgi:hypothetical protein